MMKGKAAPGLSLNKVIVSRITENEMIRLNGGRPNISNDCYADNNPEDDLSNANGGRCWFGTVFCPL